MTSDSWTWVSMIWERERRQLVLQGLSVCLSNWLFPNHILLTVTFQVTENCINPTAMSQKRDEARKKGERVVEIVIWMIVDEILSGCCCPSNFNDTCFSTHHFHWVTLHLFPFPFLADQRSIVTWRERERRKKQQLLWYTWWGMLRVDRDQIRFILASTPSMTQHWKLNCP